MSWSKRSDAGRRPTHGFKGTAPPWPYTTGKRPCFRRSCSLPARSVGATRWVARRRTRRSGVAFCGTIVHDGARATHRVAPTPRACSRVRCAAERRSTPGVPTCSAILDTHESLRGLKVGCCHRRQPAGKFGPDNIHDTRGNARTSHPPAKPRPRTSRQGPTTNPAGKEANREQAILAAREFVCVSGKSCPRISVRVPKFFVPKLFSCCETARARARFEARL